MCAVDLCVQKQEVVKYSLTSTLRSVGQHFHVYLAQISKMVGPLPIMLIRWSVEWTGPRSVEIVEQLYMLKLPTIGSLEWHGPHSIMP